MRAGFLQLDASMENLPGGTEKERSGTTAICAILTPDYIFFANLGIFDSLKFLIYFVFRRFEGDS